MFLYHENHVSVSALIVSVSADDSVSGLNVPVSAEALIIWTSDGHQWCGRGWGWGIMGIMACVIWAFCSEIFTGFGDSKVHNGIWDFTLLASGFGDFYYLASRFWDLMLCWKKKYGIWLFMRLFGLFWDLVISSWYFSSYLYSPPPYPTVTPSSILWLWHKSILPLLTWCGYCLWIYRE